MEPEEPPTVGADAEAPPVEDAIPPPLPPSNDVYTLIFGFLIAIVVIGITYVYFKRQNEKQAQLEEADWLTGLQTQLPVEAADAFEAAYDEAAQDRLAASANAGPLDNESEELQKERKELCELLLRRAEAFLVAYLPAKKEFMTVQKTAQKKLISDADLQAAVADLEAFNEERMHIHKAADGLKPGFPGWGGAILQEAYNRLREKARRAPMDDDDENYNDDDNGNGEQLDEEFLLRYNALDRVECNMGEVDGYQLGTVVEAWELPYRVVLDHGGRCSAPIDNDICIRAAPPETIESKPPPHVQTSLWVARDGPLRFNPGEVIMAKLDDVYVRGRIVGCKVETTRRDSTNANVKILAAYAIRIEPTGPGERSKVVTAPVDTDLVVRVPTPEELKKPAIPEPAGMGGENMPQQGGQMTFQFDPDEPLRFKDGDVVMAQLGKVHGSRRGRIVGCKPQVTERGRMPDGTEVERTVMKAYAIKLEQWELGKATRVVFAPADVDEIVRKCTEEEEKAVPAMLTQQLRFKVGDLVEANLGNPLGFVNGTILKERPRTANRAPKPGEPPPDILVAAYEVELETPHATNSAKTVFAPFDEDICVRKRGSGVEKMD